MNFVKLGHPVAGILFATKPSAPEWAQTHLKTADGQPCPYTMADNTRSDKLIECFWTVMGKQLVYLSNKPEKVGERILETLPEELKKKRAETNLAGKFHEVPPGSAKSAETALMIQASPISQNSNLVFYLAIFIASLALVVLGMRTRSECIKSEQTQPLIP